MSEAKAKLSFARISPRKVNVVCALIRGKDIEMATAILQHTPKAASEYLIKLVWIPPSCTFPQRMPMPA